MYNKMTRYSYKISMRFFFSIPTSTYLLPQPNLDTIPTAVNKSKIMIDAVKVTVLDHGEAL
jgi:hypothetical protein